MDYHSKTSILKKRERQSSIALGRSSCTHFIDDLEEVLGDPAFPPQVKRILFADGTRPERRLPYTICLTWLDIADVVFNERL